ncbi:hypothetical protein BD779DRAFT_1749568 [Infundibulicybe gibba]|nr:hypothetical protein BD779DRAFT_1749568 [Infundibulicybe gibba]
MRYMRGWISIHRAQTCPPTAGHLVSKLKLHEFDEALRHHPPARDFMAFLNSRFQMGDGVKYLCQRWYDFNKEEFDSFLKALYTWIEQNLQDTRSFVRCQGLLTAMDSWPLERAHDHQSFCNFEVFLVAQIAGNSGAAGQGPARDLQYVHHLDQLGM